MAETTTLENALQSMLDRLVETRLDLLRQELTRELRAEISAALGGVKLPGTGAAQAGSSVSELNQAIARVLQPSGQAEVMGASLQAAAGFSGRCILFVRRGDVFAFWRAVRFRDEVIASLRSVTIPATQPGPFKELADTQRVVAADRSPGEFPAALESALNDGAESALQLFPIVVQGRIVAALYADAGPVAAPVDAAALEILGKVTGLSLETAATRAAAVAGSSAQVAEAAPASPEGEETAQPMPPNAEPVAAASEDLPPPGSFAASIPPTPESASAVAPPPDAGALPEPDRESHRKAHRFARVAVQDLLSYHKNKIEQARRNKNLYGVLKEDIEKTRENYRHRFGDTPARSFDYLHYELVMTLAGNDPEALGAQYPGAVQGE